MSGRVVTIVLNYRCPEDTVRAVEALRTSDYQDQQTVVVDNSAEGPSTEALRDALGSEVVVLASGDNLGYAGGNNHGIRWARQWLPTYIWLVNPDTVVEPTTLSGLLRTAEAHPDAGIIGCRVLQGGTRPARIESDGGSVDADRLGETPKRHVGRFDEEEDDGRVHDVGWVSGACFMIRTTMIDEVGLLPEEYFLYYEDTEYCRRAQNAGWRTIVDQDTRIWHFRRSFGNLPTVPYLYYTYRNRIHFGVRHFEADVDDVIEQFRPFVERWRAQVARHAEGSLDTYEAIMSMAVTDARDGVFSRSRAIESLELSPTSVPLNELDELAETLARERSQSERDVARLLSRLRRDSAAARRTVELERALNKERRRSTQLEADLQRLRSTRTFRVGRFVRRRIRSLIRFVGWPRRR